MSELLRFDGRAGSRASNHYPATLPGVVIGRFRTTQTVIVIRMPEAFIVDTDGGPRHGGPDDFLLIEEPSGRMWPMTSGQFAATYEKIGDIPQ